MLELEVDVVRLFEAIMVAALRSGVVVFLEGEPADAWAWSKRSFAALLERSDADQDIPDAAVRDCTRVQWLRDAERQKRRRANMSSPL